MPIFAKISAEPGTQLAIWKVNEEADFFRNQLNLHPEELEQLSDLKSRKYLEWMASRYLIKIISPEGQPLICIKDQHGKPFLKDSPFHISLSHSNNMTAVIKSRRLAGLDIQLKVEKIDRIAHRFISHQELKMIGFKYRLETIHVLWGAKECLYKAYGKRSLDFKRNMVIEPFIYDPDGFSFKGSLTKDQIFMQFELYALEIENYILVYALEI